MTLMTMFNRTLLPAAINAAGATEVGARELFEGADVSALVRRKPAETIGLAMIAGLVLGRLTLGGMLSPRSDYQTRDRRARQASARLSRVLSG